jgi:hypothetical protein
MTKLTEKTEIYDKSVVISDELCVTSLVKC